MLSLFYSWRAQTETGAIAGEIRAAGGGTLDRIRNATEEMPLQHLISVLLIASSTAPSSLPDNTAAQPLDMKRKFNRWRSDIF